MSEGSGSRVNPLVVTGMMPPAMRGEGAKPMEFSAYRAAAGGRNTVVFPVTGPDEASTVGTASGKPKVHLVHGIITMRLNDA